VSRQRRYAPRSALERSLPNPTARRYREPRLCEPASSRPHVRTDCCKILSLTLEAADDFMNVTSSRRRHNATVVMHPPASVDPEGEIGVTYFSGRGWITVAAG
jgi:hypothetical protein